MGYPECIQPADAKKEMEHESRVCLNFLLPLLSFSFTSLVVSSDSRIPVLFGKHPAFSTVIDPFLGSPWPRPYSDSAEWEDTLQNCPCWNVMIPRTREARVMSVFPQTSIINKTCQIE